MRLSHCLRPQVTTRHFDRTGGFTNKLINDREFECLSKTANHCFLTHYKLTDKFFRLLSFLSLCSLPDGLVAPCFFSQSRTWFRGQHINFYSPVIHTGGFFNKIRLFSVFLLAFDRDETSTWKLFLSANCIRRLGRPILQSGCALHSRLVRQILSRLQSSRSWRRLRWLPRRRRLGVRPGPSQV